MSDTDAPVPMPDIEERPPPKQPHDLEVSASLTPHQPQQDKKQKEKQTEAVDPHAFHKETQMREEAEDAYEDRASSGVRDEKELSLLDQQVPRP